MLSAYCELTLVFGIVGVGIIVVGVWTQLGRLRGLYLSKGFPGHPSGYVYGYLPIGLFSLLIGFLFLLPYNRNMIESAILYGSLPLLVFAIILMIWKPRWLKPWWLKWLEDHYSGAILEVILEEARQSKDFEDQTPDEASLSAWVHTALERYKSQSQS